MWMIVVSALCIAYLWYKDKMLFTVDQLGLDEPMKGKDDMLSKIVGGEWELLLETKNHVQAPHVIIKTTSFDLASYIMSQMQEAFADMGYKTFTMYIRSANGGIITKDSKYGNM
jgi:hypothetical protein